MSGRDSHIGKRVRIIKCGDVCSPRPYGLEGTVHSVDDIGTVHVNWDNGSMLGLIPGEDEWEYVDVA